MSQNEAINNNAASPEVQEPEKKKKNPTTRIFVRSIICLILTPLILSIGSAVAGIASVSSPGLAFGLYILFWIGALVLDCVALVRLILVYTKKLVDWKSVTAALLIIVSFVILLNSRPTADYAKELSDYSYRANRTAQEVRQHNEDIQRAVEDSYSRMQPAR